MSKHPLFPRLFAEPIQELLATVEVFGARFERQSAAFGPGVPPMIRQAAENTAALHGRAAATVRFLQAHANKNPSAEVLDLIEFMTDLRDDFEVVARFAAESLQNHSEASNG